jgi:hypothetical protein
LEIERSDPNESGGVAPGGDGDFNERNFNVENLDFFLRDAEAVNFVEVGGGLEIDDEIESFLGTDRGEALKVGDVDDADAAHFEIASGEIFGGG